MRTLLSTFTLILLVFCVEAQWKGKVTEVIDGDTYEIRRTDGSSVTVRLYGIDCPEDDQSYGDKATQRVRDKILNHTLRVEKITIGTYGRTIARVYYNSEMINEWLIKNGLAWVYPRYCDDPVCDNWKNIQQRTKRNKTGLWSQGNPTPPWEYRHK